MERPKTNNNRKRFIYANEDLPLRDGGVDININELNDGSLSIAMGLRCDTTHRALRRAIPLAIQWRDRLLEWQGPSQTQEDRLLNELCEIKAQGYSYLVIARGINHHIARFLRDHLVFLKACEIASNQFRIVNDYYDWLFRTWLESDDAEKEVRRNQWLALERAERILSYLRMENDDIKLWLHDGLDRLRTGNDPFDKDRPLTQSKLTSVLRYWMDSKKKIMLQTPNKDECHQDPIPVRFIQEPADDPSWGREAHISKKMNTPWRNEWVWKPLDLGEEI